jgi:hypothetical protein
MAERWSAGHSVFAHVPEVDPERAKLPVEVSSLHAHPLGELADLAVTQK